MGYFSNGTEGESFEALHCSKCIHEAEGTCPVMVAHLMYAYELCNEKDHPGKVILDMLIVRKTPFEQECAMFVAADRLVRQ